MADLEILIAGGTANQKLQAQRILPVRKRGNLLLCTLLMGNAVVNAFLSILTASMTSGFVGAALSTGFILIFGEILPQSVCSRYGLYIGSKTVDIVRLFMLTFFVVAWPISIALDKMLGKDLGTIYSRSELMELFTMQAKVADVTTTEASPSKIDGLGQTEAMILCGALSLSEKTAEQIMTKMADVFCVFEDDELDFQLMRHIADSGHTRIPVLRAGCDVDAPVRAEFVAGLLSTKDLILIDPEDSMPVGTLLKHCGRPVMTFRNDTPVTNLFRNFKRGKSHLAFVQRVNDIDNPEDSFNELSGLVTLEDVLEELIQSEIVDETDVYTDNDTMNPVEQRQEDALRRSAWQTLLDPQQLHSTELKRTEIQAICSFLVANALAFSTKYISNNQLEALLQMSSVEVLQGTSSDAPLYERGTSSTRCTIVLQGCIHMVCGAEAFEGERGAWSLIALNALSRSDYVADFTAHAVGPTRVLVIARDTYEEVLQTVPAVAPIKLPLDSVMEVGVPCGELSPHDCDASSNVGTGCEDVPSLPPQPSRCRCASPNLATNPSIANASTAAGGSILSAGDPAMMEASSVGKQCVRRSNSDTFV
eukprot:CAMPEP_0119313998 /NCGR_PEP_ID=MMETSP1333-20130426/31204_1 /TAXON_ID=418940 /ORGANISM="Scyphosphaera apsteinii, Strain RCC1455" /LENGTH=591 /DNA_ID=CAMNT_0007319007 /DNA_START=301 /DNA_END=2076 /DNA_ORIENTATION=-